MNSKILIVDDDEKSICMGFEMILSDAGYEVMIANNYDQAMEIISLRNLDLIISDVILGGQTGIDLLAEVKKRKLHCPMIMITEEPNVDTSAKALRLGAFDYLTKPIRKETLLRIVHNSVRHKKLLDKKQKLEKENLRVRQNMEAIFNSIEDAIICVDNNLNIMDANPAMEKNCGFPINKIVGKSFREIQTDCNNICVHVLEKILKTNKSVKEFHVECKRPGKPAQTILLTATTFKLKGRKSNGAVLILRNVTQLQNFELELKERHRFHEIISKSLKMKKLFSLLENMSEIDSTVLITGETGTGKELFANAIHHNSQRRDKPFIKLNCSALSENLLESELFGHIKGAFTGAVTDKKGRFEMADQGTLLLDELGDISPLTQLKLLRVLQEKEFERVGDSTPLKVDVRIIAATNANLKEKVKQGRFREDLFYRINVVNIPVPALRDRREDIPMLTDHFLTMFNKRFKKQVKGLSNEAMNAFMTYAWPGNIRELEHAVEYGFVLGQDDILLYDNLPLEIKEYFKFQTPPPLGKTGITKQDVLIALEKTRWNKSKAAQLLGVARRTIYRRIKEFDIKNP